MEVIMASAVEVVKVVLPLLNNSKNQHNSNTSQLRILKAPTPSLLNPFKWRMFNKDSQVFHRDKLLLSHPWRPENPTISLCLQEDPRVVLVVQFADHPSNLQQHP